MQRIPADLRPRDALHGCAEHVRQQLCTKTDAEHGATKLEHALDRTQLRQQVRPRIPLLHVHRPAQHDQAAVALHARQCLRLTLEVDEANAVAAAADQRVERAQRLGGDMLKDEDAGHGLILEARSAE